MISQGRSSYQNTGIYKYIFWTKKIYFEIPVVLVIRVLTNQKTKQKKKKKKKKKQRRKENVTNFRPDYTSKLVHVLAFGTPKFYIAPYDKIKHELVNLSSNCDVKSGLNL